MNRAIKRAIERTLIAGGATRFGRFRLRDKSLVLAYHNVVPSGLQPSGDLNLHLPQHEFAAQLDILRRHHDVVPLTSLLEPARTGAHLRVAITFDDAYAGALDAGVRELVARGMPATIFVAPGLLGGTAWWDVLADPTRGLDPDFRTRALNELAGKRDAILREAGPTGGEPTAHDTYRIGSLAELARAAGEPGITLASHTWSHPNLCALSRDELLHELSSSLQWLQAHHPSALPWLTYPYGLWSHDIANAAADAGYVAALRVDGGWFDPRSPSSRYALPRLNIPAGLSLDGFALRLAGIGSQG
jgi:peptidoglycan/xylan/chitin deacetylase (PgdA/CDA1 family)